jgi:antirestriction protein ArdC
MNLIQQDNAGTSRLDVYTKITNQILTALEQGVRPWQKPWSPANTNGKIMRPLRHNGEPYSGINILMLWGAAIEEGYASPIWMTFKQANEFKAHVRKGERGSLVVYANKLTKSSTDNEGNEVDVKIPFLKGYTVFNVEQIEGLPEIFYTKPQPKLDPPARIEHAEAFLAATGADVRIRGSRAYYAIDPDYIALPPRECFEDAESFYSTALHELCHWTRHSSRLNRDFGRKKFGDEGYSREELVAELGSAFLCCDLELTPVVREDHASYIAEWITVLKNDKRAIVQAASYAQRAVDFLHSLQQPKSRAA